MSRSSVTTARCAVSVSIVGRKTFEIYIYTFILFSIYIYMYTGAIIVSVRDLSHGQAPGEYVYRYICGAARGYITGVRNRPGISRSRSSRPTCTFRYNICIYISYIIHRITKFSLYVLRGKNIFFCRKICPSSSILYVYIGM